MSSNIFQSIGQIVGSYFGGPVGAMIGGMIGQMVGDALFGGGSLSTGNEQFDQLFQDAFLSGFNSILNGA